MSDLASSPEQPSQPVSRKWPSYTLLILSGLVLLGWMGSFSSYILDHKHSVINEVDCEGYYLIGKAVAEGNMGAWDEDYFRYHGHPYVTVSEGKVLSKYPPGYPLLLAMGYTVGGYYGALWINTLCAWLFVIVFAWLLIRLFDVSVAALLFPVCVFYSHQTLHEIVYPYAHGPDLTFSLIALLLVVEYARKPLIWLGILAGFAMVVMPSMRPTSVLYIPAFLLIGWGQYRNTQKTNNPVQDSWWRVLWRIFWPIAAGMTVCALVWCIFNWQLFGGPMATGYELSDEQHAFALSRFWERWQELISHKLPYVLPVWVLIGAGIGWLWALIRKPWMAGGILLWVVPAFVLYGSYYWYSPKMGTSYSRFYTSFTPAFLLAWGCILVELKWRVAKLGLLVVGTTLLIVFMPTDFDKHSRKIQYPKQAAFMAAMSPHLQTGDTVYTSNHWQAWNINVWPGVKAYSRRAFYDKAFTQEPREIKSFKPWRDGKRYREKHAFYQSLKEKGDLMQWHINSQTDAQRILIVAGRWDQRWISRFKLKTREIASHESWRLLEIVSN